MDLENYTNINIYKRTFEERQVANSRDMIEQPHNTLPGNKEAAQFNPYQNNEGTVIGKYNHKAAGTLVTRQWIFNQVLICSDCGS